MCLNMLFQDVLFKFSNNIPVWIHIYIYTFNKIFLLFQICHIFVFAELCKLFRKKYIHKRWFLYTKLFYTGCLKFRRLNLYGRYRKSIGDTCTDVEIIKNFTHYSHCHKSSNKNWTCTKRFIISSTG